MLRLILVRHGETAWNHGKRIQGGLSNPELSEKGEEQARRVALALRLEKLEAIYSSPLKRAVATARAIAGHHSLEVEIAPDLSEVNAGLLEGLSIDELTQRHGDFYHEFQQGAGSLRMPGGESMEELQCRNWAVVENILQKHPQGVVALVGHAFSLTTVMCRVLNLDLCNFNRFRFSPCGITVLHFDRDKAFLIRFNDTCHLTGGKPT